MAEFGPVLRKFRKAAGLSQERLAEVSGVSAAAIKTLEAGRRRYPWTQTVGLLADGLQLSNDERAELKAAAARPKAGIDRLPPDVADFVGRAEQIATVSDLLTGGGQAPGVVVISAIAGMGGVGKTALAVRVARDLAGQFADGVLYVNLRGFGVGEPMTPLEALNTLLQQLGFALQRPPETAEEAAGIFRTACASRKLLVVLDNAATVEQVVPLLPGTATCAVIVTSRRALVGLPGARPLELAVLADDEALALLVATAGAEWIETDLQTAREVVARCGSLPLAIRIAGSRLAAEPSWTVADLARRLADESARLDLFGDGVRASIALSLAGTSAADVAAAEIFGLLGLHEGNELDLKVAARLVDRPESEVEPLLEHLVDLHLLESASPRRYQFHDLVRAYARELAPADRTAARERVLALYVGMAWQARMKEGAGRAWFDEQWTAGFEHLEYGEVMAWLDAEAEEILAAAHRSTADRETLVVLTGGMMRFWHARRRHTEGVQFGELALTALSEDPTCAPVLAVSRIRTHLALHYAARSDLETAGLHLRDAVAAAPVETDTFNHFACTVSLAQALEQLDQLDEASELARAGLDGALSIAAELVESDARLAVGSLAGRFGRFAEQDHEFGLAAAILRRGYPELLHLLHPEVSTSYLRSGRPEAARTWLREHLPQARLSGDKSAVAEHLRSLGVAETALSAYDDARLALTEALDLIQGGNEELEARIRHNLGSAFSGLGETEPAREQWRLALDLYRRYGMPEADEVLQLLDLIDDGEHSQETEGQERKS
ncbi:XRE family transcriptional regulator [Kribbella antibiotica]|uniref:XRE family transcriptional regulator n=1 Tax=Kribbella antibiotica TaxID=190195 RepID=A0A4R4ZNJ1_9ACTN|nr:XRE family transcriptional regulator [Kribbella antibiotica]TDD60451.1 XRE family transcriptional regulator [Kribbella antibiotica]